MKITHILAMLALAAAGGSAFATTRYVSLLGSDETGSGCCESRTPQDAAAFVR